MGKARLALAIVALLAGHHAASGQAPPDPQKAAFAAMQRTVGKRFWVVNPPGPTGVEFCPSPTGRFKECRRLTESTFLVEGVAPSTFFPMFRVTLENGEKGFIPFQAWSYFKSPSTDASTRERIRRCERAGPDIGMTSANVTECLGSADRVNTTQTANGLWEQWIYRGRFYVYLNNGTVTAIQTSR